VETCAWRHGRGKEGAYGRCHVCMGKGSLPVSRPAQKCPDCLCTGRREEAPGEPCARCGGTGWEGAYRPAANTSGTAPR